MSLMGACICILSWRSNQSVGVLEHLNIILRVKPANEKTPLSRLSKSTLRFTDAFQITIAFKISWIYTISFYTLINRIFCVQFSFRLVCSIADFIQSNNLIPKCSQCRGNV